MNHQAAIGSDNLAAARRWVLPAALLVAVTLLAYLPAMRGGFFADDYTFLVHNPLINAPDGLHRLWFTTESAEYLPLTYTTYWVEWRLWGDHPAGYHIVNILLHAGGAVLLWRVLRRLCVPGAWLAGLLFAVHPAAVASVAWIMERKNVLSMVLFLASLLAFLGFDEAAGAKEATPEGVKDHPTGSCHRSALPRSHIITYVASLALFLLALLSKTSVVMLPVVLLLCAWWRRGMISRRDLLRSLPFLALSLALGLVTIWFQWHNAIRGWTVRPEGAASRIAAAGWIAWFYLYKVLLPAGLCVIYPRWNVDGSSVLAFLPLLLLLGGMAFLWSRRKSWGRAPFFAAAYFLITLLPVLGFVNMLFMGLSLAADHLQYLAMIGIIALAAGFLARAFPERIRTAAAVRGFKGRAGVLATVGCVAALGILTRDRAALYAHPEALWRDNLARNPAGSVWNARATEYLDAGRLDRAVRCFDRAIELGLKLPVVYFNRGNAYAKLNRIPQAIADYDAAVELQPDYPEVLNSRGIARERMGLRELALRDYDRAIELKPDFAEAYFNRSVAYGHLGKFDEAIRGYSEAIRLKPGYFQAYNNRGKMFADTNRLSEAVRDYDQAIFLNPDYPEALYNRGNARADANSLAEAIRDYDRATALKPDYREAYNNRAVVCYQMKQYDKALADVKMFQTLGGRPNPDFLKALTEAARGSE